MSGKNKGKKSPKTPKVAPPPNEGQDSKRQRQTSQESHHGERTSPKKRQQTGLKFHVHQVGEKTTERKWMNDRKEYSKELYPKMSFRGNVYVHGKPAQPATLTLAGRDLEFAENKLAVGSQVTLSGMQLRTTMGGLTICKEMNASLRIDPTTIPDTATSDASIPFLPDAESYPNFTEMKNKAPLGCVMAGVLEVTPILIKTDQCIKLTIGLDSKVKTKITLKSNTTNLKVGDVLVITDAAISRYEQAKQNSVSLYSSTGLWLEGDTWTDQHREWKAKFNADEYCHVEEIGDIRDLASSVRSADLSELQVKVRAFLSDYTGDSITRMVCGKDGCYKTVKDGEKTCPFACEGEPKPEFCVMVNLAHEVDPDATGNTKLDRNIVMYNEASEALFKMTAADYLSLDDNGKDNVFLSYFDKQYDFVIDVTKGKEMFPYLKIKTITPVSIESD